MVIKVTCDSCGANFSTEEKNAGRKTRCLKCGAEIQIPSLEDILFRKELEELAHSPREEEPQAPKEEISIEESPSRAQTAPCEPTTPPTDSASIPAESKPQHYIPTAEISTSEPSAFDIEEPSPTQKMPAPSRSEAMSESIPKPQEQPIETQASDVSAGMKRLAKAVNLAALLGVAFVFVDVFESVGKVAESHGRATLHGLIDWLTRWAAIVPGRLSGVTLDLSSKLHPEAFTSLERVVFAIAVGIVALRMFFKTKIIQAIYLESVLSPRRSVAGLLFHFAVFMSFILGLAGVAALVKSGEESVVCLTAALCLVLITVWLIIVHFQVGDEYPHIAWWALNNSLFGLLIIANTLLLPSFNLPMPFSRGGAAALLLLLNSALGLMIGARFVFECESVGRFGRRLGFMVLSLFLIGCVAAFLLTQRV